MSKKKKDLLKKKLIAQALAQAQAEFSKTSPSPLAPKAAFGSKKTETSAIAAAAGSEYVFVSRDIKRIAYFCLMISAIFAATFVLDSKYELLKKVATKIFALMK